MMIDDPEKDIIITYEGVMTEVEHIVIEVAAGWYTWFNLIGAFAH